MCAIGCGTALLALGDTLVSTGTADDAAGDVAAGVVALAVDGAGGRSGPPPSVVSGLGCASKLPLDDRGRGGDGGASKVLLDDRARGAAGMAGGRSVAAPMIVSGEGTASKTPLGLAGREVPALLADGVASRIGGTGGRVDDVLVRGIAGGGLMVDAAAGTGGRVEDVLVRGITGGGLMVDAAAGTGGRVDDVLVRGITGGGLMVGAAAGTGTRAVSVLGRGTFAGAGTTGLPVAIVWVERRGLGSPGERVSDGADGRDGGVSDGADGRDGGVSDGADGRDGDVSDGAEGRVGGVGRDGGALLRGASSGSVDSPAGASNRSSARSTSSTDDVGPSPPEDFGSATRNPHCRSGRARHAM